MHFFEPGRLIFLWLLPLIFLLFVWGNKTREKRLTLLGNPHFMKEKLIRGISEDARRLSWAFLLLAFFFSVLALARPQWGEEKRKVERKGVDLVFLLDTSLSMLAEDVKPNRLGKAKLEMKNMIRKLKGDRVGMVAFAGSSFLQCPLTLDYGAFLLFVDALKPGYIPDPGTSLSNALRLAVRAFPQDSNKYRAIIIFSDGEDHEGGVDQAIEEAKKAGIRVYAVGVGTPEGDPIPLHSGLGPQQGPSTTTAYKKDKQGQVVITRLNPEILSRIAKETGGLYLQATPGEREIDVILKHLETLGQRKLKERLITEREEHFQIFLFLAFLFLAAETLLRYYERHYEKRQTLMKAVLSLFILFFFSGFMDSPHSLVEKGNRAVEDKKYQTAVESYRKAQVTDPSNPVIRYNLGTALYHQYEYRGAEKELQQSLSQVKDPKEKAKILYNYANTLYRLGDFEKAIQNYKKVLEIDPKDEDAKYNLEFLQKKKAQFEKQNQERQKQQKQNPQQNPQQNQQQQQGQQSQKQQEQSQPQSGDGQDDKQNSQSGQQNKDQQQKSEGSDDPSDQNQQGQEREQEKQEGSQKSEDLEGQEQEKEDLEKNGQGTQTKKEEEQQKEKKGEDSPASQAESQQEQPQPQQGSGQEEEQPQVTQEAHQPMEEQSQGQGGSEDQPQGEKSDQQTNSQAQQPLQGQMSKENALRILDALREGDKQLQDVRHPTRPGNSREVSKDW